MSETTIRLTGPGDILVALSYQLGYHPKRSVVLVCLRDRRVELIQRIDTPDYPDFLEAGQNMIAPMLRQAPTSVVLVGYDDEPDESGPFLDLLAEATRDAGIKVNDVLAIRDGRWYSRTCTSTCCPAEGTPLEQNSLVATQFISVGKNPLKDRQAVANRLEPSIAAGAFIPLRSAPTAPELLTALKGWTKILAGGALTAQETRTMVASLIRVDFRDGLLAHMNPGTLPLDMVPPEMRNIVGLLPEMDHEGGVDRLVTLCADVPDGHATPVLTVLAAYAWHTGEGALARMALARALRGDPDYRLAHLMTHMVELGIQTNPNRS